MREFVDVQVPSRLHLTLIGMNSGGYRINGGVGFAISAPEIRLKVTAARKMEVLDARRHPWDEHERGRLRTFLEVVQENAELHNSAVVEILDSPSSHHGFGTGTGMRLGAIEGLLEINERELPREAIIALSNRGGTSGIGINTYFDGGIVVDIGHSGVTEQLPSGTLEGCRSAPLRMASGLMPEWKIGVCIPNELQALTREQERDFFLETCPIKDAQVYETLYHSVYGIFGSAMEARFSDFCLAVNKIQKSAWKTAERSLYGTKLTEIEDALYKCGAKAVGMSSLGPSLFFLGDDLEDIVSLARIHLQRCQVFSTSANNVGRKIVRDA